jgi:hypothetical protein
VLNFSFGNHFDDLILYQHTVILNPAATHGHSPSPNFNSSNNSFSLLLSGQHLPRPIFFSPLWVMPLSPHWPLGHAEASTSSSSQRTRLPCTLVASPWIMDSIRFPPTRHPVAPPDYKTQCTTTEKVIYSGSKLPSVVVFEPRLISRC